MESIPMCPSCGNTKSGDQAKKCSRCGKITCPKCSFTGCTCGSMSVKERYIIKK
jgi:hypothetical protein